ncbi:MAG: HD-GYP domain-containing protein [Chloroflexi bacterium]|nr:HD-GYP domain-containing protein [Chloroflexota bacterium]
MEDIKSHPVADAASDGTNLDDLARAQQQLVAYARDLKRAYSAERDSRRRLQQAYFDTVRALAAAADARDLYTGSHIDRVTQYCLVIAKELGWSEERLRTVEMGAVLHDIGKIGIEDGILRKQGPLDDAEWRKMRQHPEIGRRIIEGIQFLEPAVPFILYHHERWDGRGYLAGLKGDEIPAEGRIVAIADALDAMLTDRPYRAGMPPEHAIAEIKRSTGSQFDPMMVEALISAWQSNRFEELLVQPATEDGTSALS